MGLVVVGLGLLDISFWYFILDHFTDIAGPGSVSKGVSWRSRISSKITMNVGRQTCNGMFL